MPSEVQRRMIDLGDINMKQLIGTRIWVSLFAIFVILIMVGGVSYQNMRKLSETAHWVDHTYSVLINLKQFESSIKDAETGQRGYVITGEDRYLEPYNSSLQNIGTTIQELKDLTRDNPDQQRRLVVLGPLVSEKLAEMKDIVALRRNKGFAAARAEVLTDKGKRAMDGIRKVIREMEDEERNLLKQRSDEANASSQNLVYTLIIGSGLAGLIVVLAGLILTKSIFRLIGRLGQEMREGSSVLAASAGEILATTTQVASGAAETASAVTETTATVEEVKQTAALSSQKAKYVSESAQKVAQVSQTGRNSVEGAIQGMQRIQEQMESIAESIVHLSEQGQTIGEIIATVNDLAEQSNLLAVNAAIEAAKAGEHGKGFGVVAQEVKSLAEQSKQATAQVRTILGEIQKATSAAVLATEQGSKAVEAGVKQSMEAGEAIRQLADSVQDSAQAAVQIAASSQQQMVGMDQVALAMGNIKQASMQNVAGTKQAEAAAQNLHELGQKLLKVLEQYKI
jgi:methyl-accepting chemotaxis protein